MGLGGNKDKAMRSPYCITFGEYMGDETRASGRGRSFNFTSLMLAFRMLKHGYKATNDGFKGQHVSNLYELKTVHLKALLKTFQ